MEFNSIAMIETNGLVSSITALEKMLKLGDIKFLKKEIISNGQVTVFISGDVPHLKRVLEAGEIAAKHVGIVISSSLMENPTKEIMGLILESKKEIVKTKRNKKRNNEVEKIETLFDNVVEDAILEESTKVKSEEVIVEETILEVSEKDFKKDKTVSDSDDFIGLIPDEESENVSLAENYLVPEDETLKESSSNDEIIVEEENKNNLPTEITAEITSRQNIDLEEDESDEELNLANEDVADKDQFANLSHLERLRAEAKLEVKTELQSDFDNKDYSVDKDEEIEVVDSVTPSNKQLKIEDNSTSNSSSKIDETEYSNMNVPQLRKLARNNANFPIKGRDISKANRKVLLEYFSQIL